MAALTGNEVLFVQGVDGAGHPSGETKQCTTQDIADLGGGGGGGSGAYRQVTLPGPVNMDPTDGTVGIKKTVPETTTVNLPSGPTVGREFTVVDEAGNASQYRITLIPPTGKVNGQNFYQMNSDRQSTTFYFNGTDYIIK